MVAANIHDYNVGFTHIIIAGQSYIKLSDIKMKHCVKVYFRMLLLTPPTF